MKTKFQREKRIFPMATGTCKNKDAAGAVDQSQTGIIKNRKAALQWLQEAGWKCSRANFYKHAKQGKIPVKPAGTVDLDDLKIYAAAYLQPTERPPDHRMVVAVHERERAARIELLQARKRKLDFENDLAAGRYVERDAAVLEFCVKIGLFEAMTKTAARSAAEAWALLINGDVDRAGELYAAVAATIDEALDEMGRMDEIKVTIKRQPEVKTNGTT